MNKQIFDKDLPSKDGKDHINIYSRGATELGRFLTNPTILDFEFNFTGLRIISIEHLWFYLGTRDKRILDLKSPWDIKPFIRNNKIEIKKCKDFRRIIVSAMCRKIYLSEKKYFDAFVESTLPFKHYYFYGERDNAKVYLQPQHDWQVKAWELIRHEMKKPTQSFKTILALSEQFGD